MTIIGWLRLALITWQAVAGKTSSTADDKLSAEISAALDEYEKHHGLAVTKVDLESLRVTKLW